MLGLELLEIREILRIVRIIVDQQNFEIGVDGLVKNTVDAGFDKITPIFRWNNDRNPRFIG